MAYVVIPTYGGGKKPVHRLIVDAEPGERVTFLDGDPFNLCRSNLNIPSRRRQQQQQQQQQQETNN